MKAVLILSVGTSAEPLIKAVEEARDEVDEVLLVYGRPFEGQKPSPFDVAHEIKLLSEKKGLSVRTFEVPDPEDFNVCLKVAREAIEAVRESDRIVVNYTGATKSLAAALAHVALSTEIAGELIFEYIGGSRRDQNGRVIGGEMKIKRIGDTLTAEISRRIINLLEEVNYAVAFYLSERLPEMGWAGFLRKSTEALWLWDNFDYESATAIIRDELQQNAQAFLDHDLLSPIAETIARLARASRPLRKNVPLLRRLSSGDKKAGFPEHEAMALICADTLENARRRMRQGRATDAVLRAYRAVEVAVQGKLMSMGINPWLPDWEAIDPEAKERFQKRMGYLPNDIALSAGICLIESLSGRTLDERKNDMLRDLQRSRNMSYLEHGYARLDGETAERLISYAQTLAETVLDVDLKELREKVKHLC